MSEQRDQLRNLRVASPCSADWDLMEGDERVRFCGQCNLHVYNISEMSRAAAIALVADTEGRLCTRFFRRPDGTVLTKDCPTGLRAVRARASRAAGAVLSATFSFLSGVTARATPGTLLQGSVRSPITVKRVVTSDAQDASASLTGTIFDSSAAVIAGAKIILLNNRTRKERTMTCDEEGRFHGEGLEAGGYVLTVESPGFRSFETQLSLKSRESVRVDVTLDVAVMGEIILPPEEKELKTEATPPHAKIRPRQ